VTARRWIVSALKERSHGGVEVELDGEPWRVVPADAVVRAGLVVGRSIDRVTARALARELRRSRALTSATRALAARDRSRRALDQRLARAGVPSRARGDALATLERAGLVDDSRFARARASALVARGYGDAAIRADLEHAGVLPDLVSETVAALEPERARVRQALERHGRSPRTLRRLAARGFEPGTIADEAALEAEFADGA
jgi:SOS response regulatory protein OraA/RecX